MVPELDLFHQLYFADQGYTAIIDYTDSNPQVDIYTPDGEWCGCTNASNHFSRLSAVREIIDSRIAYEKGITIKEIREARRVDRPHS